MKKGPQIILALDVNTLEEAERFVDKLYPKIKIFKVGIHLFTAYGPKIVETINKKGAEVFLDLKFFDIPNTVSGAVRSAVKLKVKMLTLHILGDEEMLKGAVLAAKDKAEKVSAALESVLSVLASEVRTSFDYYESQSAASVVKIFLSGGSGLYPGLKDMMGNLLGIEVEYWDPFRNIGISADIEMEKLKGLSAQLAVAAGLALHS